MGGGEGISHALSRGTAVAGLAVGSGGVGPRGAGRACGGGSGGVLSRCAAATACRARVGLRLLFVVVIPTEGHGESKKAPLTFRMLCVRWGDSHVSPFESP